MRIKNNGSHMEVNIIGEDKHCIGRYVGYPRKAWNENLWFNQGKE
jgi:hypothetical protein